LLLIVEHLAAECRRRFDEASKWSGRRQKEVGGYRALQGDNEWKGDNKLEFISSEWIDPSSLFNLFYSILSFFFYPLFLPQAGITTFNIDVKPSPGAQRTSFTSKSCTSMLDNTNSDFAGFSARNSIIDNGQNGDTNNNFHIECSIEEEGASESGSEGNAWKRMLSFTRLRRLLKRKIASSKFKNIQIEMLYQRYLLRMNQNNAVHIVWLLFALIFVLAIIHVNFLLNRWNDELKCENSTRINHEASFNRSADAANLTIIEDELNSTFSLNQSLNQSALECSESLNTYELLGTNFIQFSLLGLCSILYTILLLCLYKQRINEIYLFHVSYAIIISLVIIDISFSITNMGK
jgi:disulfide bond formation protein DsbB